MFQGKAPYHYLTAPGDPAEGMPLHWFTLRFRASQSHLENLFLKELAESSMAHIRVAMLFGVSLVALFGILDSIALAGQDQTTVMFIRYGIVVPGVLILIALSYTTWFVNQIQPMMTSCVIFVGVSLTAIIVLAPEAVTGLYFAGNMLVIFLRICVSSPAFCLGNFCRMVNSSLLSDCRHFVPSNRISDIV